jgi:hypothetical protein
MKTERIMELAGIVEGAANEIRAKRLADEIISASGPLIERTEDVLQNLDPIKDKAIRDMVITNLFELLKNQII